MLQLGISNLAWKHDNYEQYYSVIKQYGVKYVEIAPTKVWGAFPSVTVDEIDLFLKQVAQYDLSVISAQSIFYGRDDLNIFTNFTAVKTYFKEILKVFKYLNISKIVFGSPRTRNLPKTNNQKALYKLAVKYFGELATMAQHEDITICLEPNATVYKSNFLTNTEDTYEFVDSLKHSNIKLNLDLSTIILNKKNISKQVMIAKNCFAHAHVSAPFLANILKYKNEANEYIQAIKSSGYSDLIILETLENSDNQNNLQLVIESIKYLKNTIHEKKQ